MLSTISSRMIAILTAFALLLGAGATASHVVLKRQADDALVVNMSRFLLLRSRRALPDGLCVGGEVLQGQGRFEVSGRQ